MWPWRKKLTPPTALKPRPFERLQGYWLDTGANVQTNPLSERAVAELERKYGASLPHDFREYLLRLCPVNEYLNDNCDQRGTYWWSLGRIKSIPEEYEHKVVNELVARHASKYLFFADYVIWCWAWAIACSDDENRGKVVVVNGVSDKFVADSFSQFVDRYIEDEFSVA
jgi:SMI1 / KNR4 family (SUKH-1)